MLVQELMVPWYNGYGGEITMKNPTTFLSHGRFELDEDILTITELPVRTWTSTYKEFLESLMVPEEPKKGGRKKDEASLRPAIVKDIKENHTETTVLFTIRLTPDGVVACNTEAKLVKLFKLRSSISTSNIHMFNMEGQIHKYHGPEHLLRDFYEARLNFYTKRKEHLLKLLGEEHARLANKVCVGCWVAPRMCW